jgi:cysteinyl-tRNA synthetase
VKLPVVYRILTESIAMLHIYNSLSRKKEIFVPIEEGKVGLYVCGMTVYDLCHLGHARVLVVFDMVVRFMRSLGYDVNYIRNITDIDDKIIERANLNKEDFADLTERFIKAMHEDSSILNVLPPDVEPRATAHIGDIIAMIQQLQDKGFAYQGKSGDIYYRVRKFETYGKLSGKDIDELRVGARVQQDDDKEDPVDFVLWKSAKPGEPYWASPWGDGRPGWHIECSAMSTKCIGDHFDIHAGGMDLQFPHHENEIAQSEAATGCIFANLWMHNGYVQIDKEKMSKSLGNFFTIREILAQDSQPARMGEIIRFMMLGSHYRSPLNYSGEALENAHAALERIYKVADRVAKADIGSMDPAKTNAWMERFERAMSDDFNTPEALAVLFDLARVINKQLDGDKDCVQEVAAFTAICATLGVAYQDPEAFLGTSIGDVDAIVAGELTAGKIQSLLEERNTAKAEKNWGRADEIRDQLVAVGVSIEDKSGGEFSWSVKR